MKSLSVFANSLARGLGLKLKSLHKRSSTGTGSGGSFSVFSNRPLVSKTGGLFQNRRRAG